MGGAYNSIERHNNTVSKWSTHWTNDFFESILMSNLSPGHEGGAARCAIEVPYKED